MIFSLVITNQKTAQDESECSASENSSETLGMNQYLHSSALYCLGVDFYESIVNVR